MCSLRPIEVESVFGDIKGNFGMRRFVLKGLEKVKLEWGLHCIAHNMRKMAATQISVVAIFLNRSASLD
ncbi:MAG: transposase [Desulfitobacterium sp.]